jgi:hypothetical protein
VQNLTLKIIRDNLASIAVYCLASNSISLFFKKGKYLAEAKNDNDVETM